VAFKDTVVTFLETIRRSTGLPSVSIGTSVPLGLPDPTGVGDSSVIFWDSAFPTRYTALVGGGYSLSVYVGDGDAPATLIGRFVRDPSTGTRSIDFVDAIQNLATLGAAQVNAGALTVTGDASVAGTLTAGTLAGPLAYGTVSTPTLQNGWTVFAPIDTPRVRVEPGGRWACLEGGIKHATTTTTGTVLDLGSVAPGDPAITFPSRALRLITRAQGGAAHLTLNTTGTIDLVAYVAGGLGSFVSLDGIRWRI
jgi:hypothetical protein